MSKKKFVVGHTYCAAHGTPTLITIIDLDVVVSYKTGNPASRVFMYGLHYDGDYYNFVLFPYKWEYAKLQFPWDDGDYRLCWPEYLLK